MYYKFLLRYLYATVFVVIIVQIIFVSAALNQIDSTTKEIDTQALVAFKSACRDCQESVRKVGTIDDTTISQNLNGNYQKKLGDMYKYYYVKKGLQIERSPEYKKYAEIIGDELTINGINPFNDKITVTNGAITQDVNFMDYAGFVPMDYALPYIQVFPSKSNPLVSKELAKNIYKSNGTLATGLSFDSDVVSQTKKILLQTITANSHVTDAYAADAKNWNRLSLDANDIPEIEIKLVKPTWKSDHYIFEPIDTTDTDELEDIIKFARGEPNIKRQLGNVWSGPTSTYYMFDQDDIIPYYDLTIQVDFVVQSDLHTMFAKTFTLEKPITRYYTVRYSLLS